jgi:hypothetical protein
MSEVRWNCPAKTGDPDTGLIRELRGLVVGVRVGTNRRDGRPDHSRTAIGIGIERRSSVPGS